MFSRTCLLCLRNVDDVCAAWVMGVHHCFEFKGGIYIPLCGMDDVLDAFWGFLLQSMTH
jgi:hypothetical protein